VIEGTIIAGMAIGAKMVSSTCAASIAMLLRLWKRPLPMRMQRASGKNIFGTETEFQIITQTGAGAYEVGEESR